MSADRIPLFGSRLKRLVDLGLDVDQILRHASISPSIRHQAKVSLTTSRYFALWAAIEAVSKDPLIGLGIGGEARTDQFDPGSFAALHSGTFSEALQRLARYKRLSCPDTICIETDGRITGISVHWLWATEPAPVALTLAAFANIHLLLRCGGGKALSQIRLERKHLCEDAERHAEHFGCEVAAGTDQGALAYANATLGELFTTDDVNLITALLPGLDIKPAAVSPLPFDVQVKALLTRMIRCEHPSMEAVTCSLCLSPRTMQRRLTEIQTTYDNILEAVRLDTACRLLSETSMDSAEIAFYLGFDEVNSFHRSFYRWRGSNANAAACPRNSMNGTA